MPFSLPLPPIDPDAAVFAAGWEACRDDGGVPEVAAVLAHPALRGCRQHLALIEVAAPRTLRVLMPSAALAPLIPVDMTGRDLMELTPGPFRRQRFGRYQRVAAQPCGLQFVGPGRLPGTGPRRLSGVLLPVRDRARARGASLVLALYCLDGKDPGSLADVAIADEAAYFDIGFGVPDVISDPDALRPPPR